MKRQNRRPSKLRRRKSTSAARRSRRSSCSEGLSPTDTPHRRTAFVTRDFSPAHLADFRTRRALSESGEREEQVSNLMRDHVPKHGGGTRVLVCRQQAFI